MKVAIRGYGRKKQLLSQLRKMDCIEVKYAIDIEPELWGTMRDGLEVISPMKAFTLYASGEIEKIFVNPYFPLSIVEKIYAEMKKMGIKESDICVPNVKTIEEEELSIDAIENGNYKLVHFRRLSILQVHIADHCNLNCKGCNHFSPLTKNKEFPSLQSIVADMNRISEVVDEIEQIYILGGEPLLNPDWKEYVREVRKIWRSSAISIFTNGLLVRNLQEEDIAFLRKWDISIVVSLYKVTWGKIDEILCDLKEKGVNCYVNMQDGPICEFSSSFNLVSNDDFREKRKLCQQKCVTVRNGKMTPCAPMMFVNIFNDYFQASIPDEKPVDIYATDFSFEALRRGLDRPMEICRYCDMTKMKKWENAMVNEELAIENWLV